MKTWNVSFYREPIHEEASIKAKTKIEATKKLLDVLQDATIESIWEIKETE